MCIRDRVNPSGDSIKTLAMGVGAGLGMWLEDGLVEFRSANGFFGGALRLVAVSYTHLDVYKRQGDTRRKLLDFWGDVHYNRDIRLVKEPFMTTKDFQSRSLLR